jgi:hypothetical protein
MAVFDENTSIEEVTVDALVGDGKKFKTVDDLARGKAESDRVIAARERELAELREELGKRSTVEELMERMKQSTHQSAADQTREGQPPSEPQRLTDEDLEQRIAAISTKRDQERVVQSNVQEVTNRLLEVYGTEDKANEVVNAKARELGVSTAFLQDVAAKSPKAFFAQLGLTEAARPSASAPRSDVRSEALDLNRSGPKPGTYAYYQALHKELGDGYYSPKVQNQLMRDAFAAAERGEDFFKT